MTSNVRTILYTLWEDGGRAVTASCCMGEFELCFGLLPKAGTTVLDQSDWGIKGGETGC